MDKSPPTAFMGLGLMGTPMAERLFQAGYLRNVWNRNSTRTSGLAAGGAAVADSPSQAVREVDIVCLCLTDDEAVRAVTFADRGIVSGVGLTGRPPPLIVDFSTSSPAATKCLANDYRLAVGGAWIDAPVSGGVKRAQEGSLIAFCGGDERDFTRAQPILATLSSRSNLMGPLGSGQATKLIAQLIAAPTLVAIAEALATAEAIGLDSRRLTDVFEGGLVDSPLLQIFGRRMAMRQNEPRIGAVGTMLKDIDNAVTMATSSGASVPFASAAADILRSMCIESGASEEVTGLVEHYARRIKQTSQKP